MYIKNDQKRCKMYLTYTLPLRVSEIIHMNTVVGAHNEKEKNKSCIPLVFFFKICFLRNAVATSLKLILLSETCFNF